jgi:hypothetical protein
MTIGGQIVYMFNPPYCILLLESPIGACALVPLGTAMYLRHVVLTNISSAPTTFARIMHLKGVAIGVEVCTVRLGRDS